MPKDRQGITRPTQGTGSVSRAHSARVDSRFPKGTQGLTNARTRIVGERTGFIADVIVAVVRAYRASVTPVWDATAGAERQLAVTLLPILVLTLLVVQSFTESRLINEEGLITLVVFAIKLKIDPLTRYRTGTVQRP